MRRISVILLIFVMLMTGITVTQAQEKLNVIATTTIIADVARNVGGDFVTVTALIPPEADAHAFILTPRSAAMLEMADIVLINGANFEESAIADIYGLARGDIVTVSQGVEVLAFGRDNRAIGTLGVDVTCDDEENDVDHADDHSHDVGNCDPHIWLNPHHVMTWTNNIADAFSTADPTHAETYRNNAANYIAELEALDAEVAEILSVVPPEKRLLVTNHNFLAYFADAYDFTILGTVIPSASTLSEPTPQEVAELVAVLEATGVPAIFSERSTSAALAEAIADEADIAVVASLYSGALSAADEPAATYMDYMRYNAHVIADALSPSSS